MFLQPTPSNNPKVCRKMCKLINVDNFIINDKNKGRIKLPPGGNCSSKNVIYAARRIHNEIYIGHTGEEIKEKFHKH